MDVEEPSKIPVWKWAVAALATVFNLMTQLTLASGPTANEAAAEAIGVAIGTPIIVVALLQLSKKQRNAQSRINAYMVISGLLMVVGFLQQAGVM